MSDAEKKRPVAYILPGIEEASPPALKQALAIRNEATVAGKCPSCESELEIRRASTGEVVARSYPELEDLIAREGTDLFYGQMRHDDDCPVVAT